MDVEAPPDWLSAGDALSQLERPVGAPIAPINDLNSMRYNALFERILDATSNGIPLTAFLRTDARDISASSLMRWINKDETRKQRFYDAQEAGSDVLASEALEIADGSHNPLEDVQRSMLKVNTRKWLVGVWNRRRYGDVKQIEIAGTISIAAALANAQNRVIEGMVTEVVEAPVREVMRLPTMPMESDGDDDE